MSELVEKVARAMLQKRIDATDETWRRYRQSDSWMEFSADAQAAIAAVFDWMAERNGEDLAKAALEYPANRRAAPDYFAAMLAILRREALG